MKTKWTKKTPRVTGFHWVKYTKNDGTIALARVKSSKFRNAVTFMGGLISLPLRTCFGAKETN